MNDAMRLAEHFFLHMPYHNRVVLIHALLKIYGKIS
jgi:hypothetical protein